MTSYKEPARKTGTGICRENLRGIRGYGRCRDRLYFRIISTEGNRGLLEQAPHREILDLSIVCYVLMERTEDGMAAALVTDSLAGYWGIQAEEIMAQAARNTPKLFPVKTDNVLSLLEKLTGAGKERRYTEGSGKWELYIMTNSYGINGFGTVLYPGALQSFADALGRDLYVLPSSRHEALLFPEDVDVSPNDLRSMVREVNRTLVMPEDFLSDSVYYYDRAENELRVTGKGDVCVRL